MENWIYAAKSARAFVRVTEPSHRDLVQLDAELDWMNHLEKLGVKLAKPIPAKSGKFVESLGGKFFVSAFQEAEGVSIEEPGDFTQTRMENWGRLMGQMHAATKSYVKPRTIGKRPQWDEERNYNIVKNMVNRGDGLYNRFQELDKWLKGLTKGPDEYGLIHADFHHGNFYVGEHDAITAFDFDDCHFQWFAYDIAVPVFFLVYSMKKKGSPLGWSDFSDSFWKGYSSANTLLPIWIESLPKFLTYRTFVMHYWCVANMRNAELDEKARAWMKDAIEYCRGELGVGTSK